jgi:hypothetical protein
MDDPLLGDMKLVRSVSFNLRQNTAQSTAAAAGGVLPGGERDGHGHRGYASSDRAPFPHVVSMLGCIVSQGGRVTVQVGPSPSAQADIHFATFVSFRAALAGALGDMNEAIALPALPKKAWTKCTGAVLEQRKSQLNDFLIMVRGTLPCMCAVMVGHHCTTPQLPVQPAIHSTVLLVRLALVALSYS